MKHRVMAMRKKGCTVQQIAQAIGCSRTTLRKQGLKLGSLHRRFTNHEVRRMVAMRKRGWTIQKIAAAVDASPSGVSLRVSHLGPIPALKSRPCKPASEVPAATRRRIVALRQ